MFIARFTARPSASAIKRRVELLPQSKAASASGTNVVNHVRAHVDGLSNELANGVVGADKVVREVRVEALHADARASDATACLGEIGAHRRRGSSLRVRLVRTR